MATPYDDIIDLPHHVSRTRPQMSRRDRAAQFAPFAALNSHSGAIARRIEEHISEMTTEDTEEYDGYFREEEG